MNRFHKEKKRLNNIRTAVQAGVFAAVFAGVWYGVQSVSGETARQQKKSLEKAVYRDMVHYYAMEGRYPESVAYMEEHYGLTYDKEKYFIDYEIIGSNLMPDVTVIEK